MKQRLISAFLGIIVLILVLLGNQTVFDVVVTLISSMAIYEVLGAVGLKVKKTFTSFSVFMPLALMLASHFSEAYMLTVAFAANSNGHLLDPCVSCRVFTYYAI